VTLAVVTGAALAAGLLLERWPGRRTGPVFSEAMRIAAAETPVLFARGATRVREDEAVLGPGPVEILLRAPAAVTAVRVTVGGQGGVLRVAGLPPVVLRPTGALLDLPFVPYHEVRGRDGRRVVFSRARLALEGEAILRSGEGPL
jgi:hypothetical protein